MSGEVETGVVIVGAGFSGLAAAHALMEAGIGFVVLEARDRVGGRVESAVNGLGERVDTGGQYFCEGMDSVIALARAHGKTWRDGLFGGRTLIQPPSFSGARPDDLFARATAIRDRINGFDPGDPSIAGLTVRGWLDTQPDAADAKACFLTAIEGLWCQPTDRLPLWYLVSNDRRITNEVPELQYFLAETMHSLAWDLARPLGERLRLGLPAVAVERTIDAVRVTTEGPAFVAPHVILAVPPATAARIDFRPPLPPDAAGALAAWESGRVVKMLIRYERPFWRDAGLSGSVVFLDPLGLYACEASPGADRATLAFFVGGAIVDAWHPLGPDGMRAAALARLAAALGPAAGAPLDVTLRDWTGDRWSGGAYSDTIMDMRATDAEEVLRAGVPRLTFACSELSPSYPGYVEGAIVAGRAAARKVLEECDLAAAASENVPLQDAAVI